MKRLVVLLAAVAIPIGAAACEPPAGSPRRLEVVEGGVSKTFEKPCQPRESYGIAFNWS